MQGLLMLEHTYVTALVSACRQADRVRADSAEMPAEGALHPPSGRQTCCAGPSPAACSFWRWNSREHKSQGCWDDLYAESKGHTASSLWPSDTLRWSESSSLLLLPRSPSSLLDPPACPLCCANDPADPAEPACTHLSRH